MLFASSDIRREVSLESSILNLRFESCDSDLKLVQVIVQQRVNFLILIGIAMIAAVVVGRAPVIGALFILTAAVQVLVAAAQEVGLLS